MAFRHGAQSGRLYSRASQDRRALYIGVTTDLSRRLEEHRQGMVHHTARYNISRLIYFESHEIAPDAIAREKAAEELATGKEAHPHKPIQSRVAGPER
jgi:putative endonuclease